jgi:hypothetical protein
MREKLEDLIRQRTGRDVNVLRLSAQKEIPYPPSSKEGFVAMQTKFLNDSPCSSSHLNWGFQEL